MEKPLSDTSPEVERLCLEELKRLSPIEKLTRMGALCALGRDLVRAMIKNDYPNCSEEELKRRFVARTYGAELSRNLLGWDPEIEGY